MIASDSTVYQRSGVVTTLKRALYASERVMPPAWHARLMSAALDVYRSILRGLYFRHRVINSVRGNRAAAARAAAIVDVMPYSLVGTGGLEATYDAVTSVEDASMPGALVECGVAQGGSAALMAMTSAKYGRRRPVWLFDSYEGLPDPTAEDFVDGKTGRHVRPLPRGSCLGTYEEVDALLFGKFGLDRRDVHMVKGWFQDTLVAERDAIGPIAVLRIDGDWYDSVKCCLDMLYDQVVSGGYVIIDDYSSCFGAQKAVDEFLEKRNLHVRLVPDGRGGCTFNKPA